MKRAALVVSIAAMALASCAERHQQTAAQALQAFCMFHRWEITHFVLTTPAQQKAGDVVCAAVNEALGS